MMHGMGIPGMLGGMGMMGRHMGMGGGMGMGGMDPWRRFISNEERVTRLQEYLKQLQSEEKAVQERIDELKKQGQTGQT